MKILAVDSTSKSASAALIEDGRIVTECFADAGLTHSVTLMPMLNSVLQTSQTTCKDIDLFAVTVGPGSFTGVRIGVAAVKGMASAVGKPCIGISTLEALAWSFRGIECTVIPALDARCAQVYTAAFSSGSTVTRLRPDEAISIDELLCHIEQTEGTIYLTGDGAGLVYAQCQTKNVLLPPALLSLSRAASVGIAAYEKSKQNEPTISANALVPEYLRIPQAQRELKKKTNTLKG